MWARSDLCNVLLPGERFSRHLGRNSFFRFTFIAACAANLWVANGSFTRINDFGSVMVVFIRFPFRGYLFYDFPSGLIFANSSFCYVLQNELGLLIKLFESRKCLSWVILFSYIRFSIVIFLLRLRDNSYHTNASLAFRMEHVVCFIWTVYKIYMRCK